jgi:hypothetical protein
MRTIALQPPRPLLLAVAIGVLAGVILHSALVLPWLSLLVREPGEADWLNAGSAFRHFAGLLTPSLWIAAIYSPFLIALAAWAERGGRPSLLSWVKLSVIGVIPLAFLAWFIANDPFDCFTNCGPSRLRDLVAVGSVLVPGAVGAWAAWFVRYGGRALPA